jgi:lysophospholipase L1-like esterase
MTERTSRNERLAFRAASVVAGLVVGLFLLEVFLRGVGVEPGRVGYKFGLISDDGSERYLCYSSNPHGEFSPAPNVDSGAWQLWQFLGSPLPLADIRKTPWCVDMRRSSLGLRDREYARVPLPGVVRIIGMGDSFAVGEGVPLEQSLFKQMEALLGERFEVVNAGKSGVDLASYAAATPRLCDHLQARRALVVVILNDVKMQRSLAERRDGITGLLNRKNNEDGIAEFRRSLELLRRNPHCEVALAIYPLMERLSGGYPFVEVHEKIAEMAREAGLPVFDLMPAFLGRDTESLQVHPTDHHPNGRANRIAAEAIVDWLTEDRSRFLKLDESD